MNLIDKFIYKLLILTFILLIGVVLERSMIIDLNNIKENLSNNINIINVVKKVNGDINIIDLGNDVIEVGLVDFKVEEVDDGYLYYQKQKNIYSTCLGCVIKIENIKGLYNVTIQDENDNLLFYQDLKFVNVKMYEIVKINDLIGQCNNYNNDDYMYYYKLNINEN